MKIILDIRKSVEENAASYFEKGKKDKKKTEGARKIVLDYRKKLEQMEEEKAVKTVAMQKPAKKDWYEKFRWFISSDSYLVIGGRDSTTNEVIIKKHTEKDDLVLHTDMAGSPFVVIKREAKPGDFPEATVQEAAAFTAVFSRGWKQGMAGFSVFSVKPEQVSKTAKSGEYISKGAFMIYGEKSFYRPDTSFGVGSLNGKVMGGPLSAVKKHCKDYVEIVQGDEKVSDVAKFIKHKIGGELDDIIRVLPANCRVRKI